MNTLQNTLSSEQNLTKTTTTQPHDAFGKKVAARLTSGQADIHHDISERLRIARQMAVAKRKRVAMSKTAGAVYGGGGSATMSFADIQTTQQAQEAAELDADLLTDALPASAYADPGFAQFLKMNADTGTEGQPQLTPLSINQINRVQEI